jgi:predicted lipoprotein with Yx(FWY)xxD motif
MQARRLSAVVLTATMAVGLAACGKDDKPITTATGGQTASTPATTPSTLAAPTTTAAPKTTVATATTGLGTVFVDATGKTLYTWDKDTSTTSACTGGCAATWPALLLPAGATTPVAGAGITNLSAVARPDDAAKMQVVWNDKPLYLYAADTAPGDTKGDGVGGTWHVAKPA